MEYNLYKRIWVKVLLLFILIFIIINIALYLISHHERIDYRDVEEVICMQHLGDSIRKEFVTEDAIKRFLNMIKKVNFYPLNGETALQESPTSEIRIITTSREKISFLFTGNVVLKVIEDADGNIIEEKSKFYMVNSLWINRIFY